MSNFTHIDPDDYESMLKSVEQKIVIVMQRRQSAAERRMPVRFSMLDRQLTELLRARVDLKSSISARDAADAAEARSEQAAERSCWQRREYDAEANDELYREDAAGLS